MSRPFLRPGDADEEGRVGVTTFLMQKEKSTVKLWTQVHAQSSDTNNEKFNQTNI